MKYAKMLSLAAVAAGALMAFIGVGTASASRLCSTQVPSGDPCPAGQNWAVNQVLDFSIPSGKSAVLVDTEGSELDKCSTSTIKGKITNIGSATETVTGSVEELTWGSCTFPTKTLKTGKLEVHRISDSANGTVTADGTFEVTINVVFASCVYGVTSGADLGEITEGKVSGTTTSPVFHANAVAEEFTESPLCPNTAKWTGTYNLTTPSGTTLSVAEG